MGRMSIKVFLKILLLSFLLTLGTNYAIEKESKSDSLLIEPGQHVIELDVATSISISYRRYFQTDWNLALKLVYSGYYRNERGNGYSQNLAKEERSELSLSFNPTVNYLIFSKNIVKVYTGGGVAFKYSNLRKDLFLGPEAFENLENYNDYYLGFLFLLQLDVNVYKYFKLFGSYEIHGGWAKRNTYYFESTYHKFYNLVELKKINIGIGIYF